MTKGIGRDKFDDDGTILSEIRANVRDLTKAEWKVIDRVVEKRQSGKPLSPGETSFFDMFPFLDSPKFHKLSLVKQRYVIAYTLRDVFGYRPADAWRFSTGDYVSTDMVAVSKAKKFTESSNVKYFLDKIDWRRVEAMGFSTNKVVEAELELAYSDITDYLDHSGGFIDDLKSLPQSARRAIKSFEIHESVDRNGEPVRRYKIKLWDKGAALQRVEKIKGMHVDQVNMTSSNTNTNINSDMTPQEAGKAYAEMMKRG
jgi:hypothetical protein